MSSLFRRRIGIPEVCGHFRNRSIGWSIGAVTSPIAVSNGGLSGAVKCERDGTNILVLPNDLARCSISSVAKACSSFGRSLLSFSLMCSERSFMRALIVDSKRGSAGFMFWKTLSCSLTCNGLLATFKRIFVQISTPIDVLYGPCPPWRGCPGASSRTLGRRPGPLQLSDEPIPTWIDSTIGSSPCHQCSSEYCCNTLQSLGDPPW